ncbi:hypothetical protein [Coxiella burnetii]|uniref:Uncharacterized protein n=1 Tax=Coxiella burnetii (strain RSA 493 / Nine Mile phase I) TaxID=227377 RepID=Q83C19_COXBU|nr:hypothetical protein [Coxiella burnetii]NP_820307.1 hypothetical protein CBU_1317 [Coxiella burnetii RSA 493]AAO90821.1 hypothetical protein CBU_1317 [Coxiella burnetii RSA 493]ABX77985.1 hypothetical protein COXBURSA331_A1468 [Coxiella burnetii RSA 331]ACJ18093.1 hypothetical protein CbuG_0692 [Coxiella burnetii CbuG_Q212]AML48815.1 hypothetical protein AUR58_06240 [Coxiella burnetii]AML54779.1 hypothetical protein AYM38_05535 [Coxiella burnetii]
MSDSYRGGPFRPLDMGETFYFKQLSNFKACFFKIERACHVLY